MSKKIAKNVDQKNFTTVITSKRRFFSLNLKEVWKYKDLIFLFVQRDFKTKYKQTILGPLWFIIQPLFTTVIYTVIFGNLAGSITDQTVPSLLFYMSGNIPWLFFSNCITTTSNTFVSNSAVFGKVYFPRLTTPIATVITQSINFIIEFLMFMLFWVYYIIVGSNIQITWAAALLPVLMIQTALLGMGFGIIISSLTTKYRDLQVLVGFGVSAWMYISPVIYSMEGIGEGLLHTVVTINPVSSIIEIIRYGYLGSGSIPWLSWGISLGITFFVLLFGIMMFNKIEKNFMDTV